MCIRDRGRLAQVVAPPELGVGDGQACAPDGVHDRNVELEPCAVGRGDHRLRRKRSGLERVYLDEDGDVRAPVGTERVRTEMVPRYRGDLLAPQLDGTPDPHRRDARTEVPAPREGGLAAKLSLIHI